MLPLSVRYALDWRFASGGRVGDRGFALRAESVLSHWAFHDFCLSLAGFFIVTGYFLKRRRHFTMRQAPMFAVILLALLFHASGFTGHGAAVDRDYGAGDVICRGISRYGRNCGGFCRSLYRWCQ